MSRTLLVGSCGIGYSQFSDFLMEMSRFMVCMIVVWLNFGNVDATEKKYILKLNQKKTLFFLHVILTNDMIFEDENDVNLILRIFNVKINFIYV